MGACDSKDGKQGRYESEDKKRPTNPDKDAINKKPWQKAAATPAPSQAAQPISQREVKHENVSVVANDVDTKVETMWDRLHQGKSVGNSTPLKPRAKASPPGSGRGRDEPQQTAMKQQNAPSSPAGVKLNVTLPARVGGRPTELTKKDSLSRTTTSQNNKQRWSASTRTVSEPPAQKARKTNSGWNPSRTTRTKSNKPAGDELTDEERRMANEIIEDSPGVLFNDIMGLTGVKNTLYEIVVAPALNPDLFSGVRAPPRGVLLFGPPGNGKTFLAKAVATECKATFINISASAITSKYVGESEKHMKALFGLARKRAPAVVFIDEIDSMLTSRSSTENDASRRLKTEFLVQVDGVGAKQERILILGATNRPYDLDDAALRRFPKRVYIPLPDKETRRALIKHEMKGESADLDYKKVVSLTEGYSCSDISALCSEAAMFPVREVPRDKLVTTKREALRPVSANDFKQAIKVIRPSCDAKELPRCKKWGEAYATTL